MADIRINSLPSTATSFNTDDYIAIDGASGGTRKMLAATLPLTDVTLGGTSGASVKSTLSARAPRQGLVFDGSTSAVATVANVPAFGTSDFTVAAWVNKKDFAAAEVIFGGVTAGFELYVNSGDGKLRVIKIATAINGESTTAIQAGKWTLVTYTRSGGSAGTFYINGISAGTVTEGSPDYSAAVSKIGSDQSGAYFNGTIAEPLIYNRALSASEVVALYEAGAPNPADIGYVSGISPAAWAPGFSSPTVTSSSGSSVTATGQYGASFSTLLGTVGAVPVTVVIDVTASNITSAKAYFANSAADSSGVAVSSVITLNQGRNVINLKRSSSATTYLCVEITGGATTWTFTGTNITVGRGLLLAPDAAQAGGGLTWYDTSGNAANITLPASGVSWNVPSSAKVATGWQFGGNVGIGVAPSARLHVLSTTSGEGPFATSFQYSNASTIISSGDGGANDTFVRVIGGKYAEANTTNLDLIHVGKDNNRDQGWRIRSGCGVGSTTNNGYLSFLQLSTSGSAITELLEAARFSTDGNLLIGKTDDSGNGKLQLASSTANSGGLGFGADVSLYRAAAGTLSLMDYTSAATGVGGVLNLQGFTSGTSGLNNFAIIKGTKASGTVGGVFTVQTSDTSGNPQTALTLDSSQNATFAGAATVNGTNGVLVNKTGGGLSIITLGDGTSGGYCRLNMRNGPSKYGWCIGAQDITDNALTITPSTAAGGATFTTPVLTVAQSGAVTVSGAIAIGNTVQTAAAVASTHKVTISIGGSTYYLLATNV